MKKGALFLFLACLFEVAVSGRNKQVRHLKTWSKAREYCREKYTDLSTNSSLQEDKDLVSAQGLTEHFWVGLYKDEMDTWRWSGGEEALAINFLKILPESEDKDKRCAARHKYGWKRKDCNRRFYFYCFNMTLDLVKENKTWEAAMEHCRLHNSDLVSLTSLYMLNYTLNTSETAQTDHVWTGLRYLADTWLWLNGREVFTWSQEELPQCPAEGHRCGALSLQSQRMESWDCADKLNFVCL